MVRVATQHAERYLFPLEHYVDLRGCQLRYMFLSTCSLETVPANLIGFSYLLTLRLDFVQVVDEVLQSIISSCRALRRLHLVRCDKLINLRISHAELLALGVHNCWRLLSISIHAEKLKLFSYMGNKGVNIEYECAPVLCELNALCLCGGGFPLGCIGIGVFPELKMLRLQFPSRIQVCTKPSLSDVTFLEVVAKLIPTFYVFPFRAIFRYLVYYSSVEDSPV